MYWYIEKVLDRTRNIRMRSNPNPARAANASADLCSFNRVSVRLHVCAIAIVRLRELACDRIDTRVRLL